MATSALPSDAVHLRELTAARRHADACAAARALVIAGAEDREILYLLALNLRCLGAVDESLQCLDEFERQHPGFSRIHQERGHCHLVRRDTEAALRSFEQAVRINEALIDSWQCLAVLYAGAGQPARSLNASRQAAHLAALPPEMVRASSLLADGDLERSEALLRDLAGRGVHAVTVLHLLGRVRRARGAWLDAQRLFEAALAEAPDLEALRLDYARLLLERQMYPAAVEQIGTLAAPSAGASAVRLMHATACLGMGATRAAIEALRHLVTTDPSSMVWLTLGDALRAAGARDESIDAYHQAARAGAYGAACWSLANLKSYRFTHDEKQQMRAALTRPGPSEDHEALYFALGTALKDTGDIEEAWRSFDAGNRLHRARHAYAVAQDEALVEALVRTCDASFFDSRTDGGVAQVDPIFIVGLPRSGSTLVEQMLASHAAIDGTRELGEIPAIVHDLGGRHPERGGARYPMNLASLEAAEMMQLARRYLAAARPYRGDASMFTDKLPNNFLHVGLIHLLLPGATIIDVRREPRDCCFSNLTQRYASGQEFSYDMTDMGRYYRLYLRLMRHWTEVLPGRILTVHHEDVVNDPAGQVRRMLDHCGLDYDERCLRFYETKRSVATPSSEQVRSPLSRSGVDAWRPYAAWLRPLEEALGDALQRYRD